MRSTIFSLEKIVLRMRSAENFMKCICTLKVFFTIYMSIRFITSSSVVIYIPKKPVYVSGKIQLSHGKTPDVNTSKLENVVYAISCRLSYTRFFFYKQHKILAEAQSCLKTIICYIRRWYHHNDKKMLSKALAMQSNCSPSQWLFIRK